jgi:YesN/AraC family two-component response regulator
MREGIAAVVGRQADMVVVGEADNGAKGLDLFRQLQPDVTLMDLQMPGLDGLARSSGSGRHRRPASSC